MATMTMDFGARRVATTPVVLTSRGRFVARAVVGMLAAALIAGVFSFGKDVAVAALSSASASAVATHTVVVQPGETLWQIAARELPNTDRRDAVARIRSLNALEGRSVMAGEAIAIPTE